MENKTLNGFGDLATITHVIRPENCLKILKIYFLNDITLKKMVQITD